MTPKLFLHLLRILKGGGGGGSWEMVVDTGRLSEVSVVFYSRGLFETLFNERLIVSNFLFFSLSSPSPL